ncbi:hypothetical protein BC940DRAFT_301685, partial [Gongronella butleri]
MMFLLIETLQLPRRREWRRQKRSKGRVVLKRCHDFINCAAACDRPFKVKVEQVVLGAWTDARHADARQKGYPDGSRRRKRAKQHPTRFSAVPSAIFFFFFLLQQSHLCF